MIYRKLIEDKHVVKLRGTQMVNKKNQLFSCNCTVIKKQYSHLSLDTDHV